jgi:DNA mismatch repair protein PMS2
VSSQNYETIALKHYTSKLSTYSDLTTLQTFGFRGEALSSLCALSRFSITTCVAADVPKGTKLDFEISGKLKGSSVVAAQKGTTVVVENLFNNLPVRRRELERNIKREWARVVGVLGQYACIQTGIKFSVSQQPLKGKKTTLFSTKGNQTTRENIINVFGAKTLTALITLDLNLELEATNAASQRWSAQENGETNDIRIVGHISRPAYGEGRQTPDRQMFFVNARPCSLPQVAKAFNEVYKSYNGTQSPFIFANIELDTHLYDVNVSPDKRTILLHDQHRMLENLKMALTELFESQDYTVPIAQLPAQKQPTYKQLTISRESSAVRSKTTQTQQDLAESVDGNDSEPESRSSRRAQSMDEDEGPQMIYDSASRKAVGLSRDSISRDQEAASPILNSIGKKSEDRAEPKSKPPEVLNRNDGEELSNDKKISISKLRKESETPEGGERNFEIPDSSVTLQSAADITLEKQVSVHISEVPAERRYGREAYQAPIPALSPTRISSTALNPFPSGRPTRASPAVATITIGNDHTITSSIGATCPNKKPRMNNVSPLAHNSRSQVSSKPLPSFGSKLSQRFTAPGASQLEISSKEDSDIETLENYPSPQREISVPESESDEDSEAVEIRQNQNVEMVEDTESSLQYPNFDDDGEYIDEDEKKAREEEKVREMIRVIEELAAQPSQENAMRAKALLRGGLKKKDSTLNLMRVIDTSVLQIRDHVYALKEALLSHSQSPLVGADEETPDADRAEEKLSLTISKTDFAKMKVVGQFNLGFILATRSSEPGADDVPVAGDELFIIDQHASDEKYNFERLQAITVVQSQPLVSSKTLDLTAVEEEIVIENLKALETNGFIVTIDESGDRPVGQRCQLVSLPVSKETTFSLADLEELLALLVDSPPGAVPRPSKVRKMFAMRACRSSIMIGRTLTQKQMGKVVKNLGELDKPWNCPHGRPTMRHLCTSIPTLPSPFVVQT